MYIYIYIYISIDYSSHQTKISWTLIVRTIVTLEKVFLFGKVTRLFNNFAKAKVAEEILLKRDSNTGAFLWLLRNF